MQYSITKKVSVIDLVVYFLLLIFFAFFFCTLDYSSGQLLTLITFFVNGLFFLYQVVKPQKCVTLKRNIYIFNLIFFFFAPLQQYLNGVVLWSYNGITLQYTDSDYIRANIFILVSCLVFELAYSRKIVKNKQLFKNKRIRETERYEYARNSTRVMKAGVVISTMCCVVVIATNGFNSISFSSAIIYQLKNMIMFTPVLYLLIGLINHENGIRHAKRYCILFAAQAIVILLGYSESIPRFILLGALMVVVSFEFSDYKHKSLYFLIYVLGFFFAFSAMRYINLFDAEIIHFVDFCQNDYDAYQFLMMTIRYVEDNGIAWGMNFVSALFCLIPRSIAPWRLELTGGIVAQYYGSWYTNVSCPLIAEMHFAFGVVGIVVLSAFLGLFIKKLDMMDFDNALFKRGVFSLFSGLSIYLLRGSFLPVFSYTIGILIAYCALYAISYIRMK